MKFKVILPNHMNSALVNWAGWQLASAALAIAISGCRESGNPTNNPPPAKAYVIDRDALDDDVWQVANTFEYYDRISESLAIGKAFELYEGLPHDLFEREQYESELANAKTIKIAGAPFYGEPLRVATNEIARLRELVGSRSSFVPFRGFKPCGGFHADWCLVWKDGEESYSAEFCFGCHELMVFQNDARIMYCDIWDCKKFEELLMPLRTNRPDEKYD